jgi:hypothetical protein
MPALRGELLMRVARQYSQCADDAQDAVQRALEIYMRRASSLDPATELAWLKVVSFGDAAADACRFSPGLDTNAAASVAFVPGTAARCARTRVPRGA